MGSFFPNLSKFYSRSHLIFVLHLSGTYISHSVGIDSVLDLDIEFLQDTLDAAPGLNLPDTDTVFYIVSFE
jgi:hypothetical protein